MLVSFQDKNTQETIKEYAQDLKEKGAGRMYNGMNNLYLMQLSTDGYREDENANYTEMSLELFSYIIEVESINLMLKNLSVDPINLSSFYHILKCLNEYSINSISIDAKIDFFNTYVELKTLFEKVMNVTKTAGSLNPDVFLFVCGIMTSYSWPENFYPRFESLYYDTFFDKEKSPEEFMQELNELKDEFKESLVFVSDLTENL